MPIRVVCPNGHALRVKDKLAGKPGVCPTCQADFVVPDLETAAPAAAEPPSTPAEPVAPAAPASAAPTPAEAVEWRVTLPDGQQFGPTVPTVFGQWILAERVTADCLVWRTGWAEWRTAADAAAELPAPLPTATTDPAAPAIPELPTGVTLPPETTASEPSPSESLQSPAAPTAGAYTLRKKRQARQRRNLAILLAVACLALIAMLVWLVVAGPPATLPVVPPE